MTQTVENATDLYQQLMNKAKGLQALKTLFEQLDQYEKDPCEAVEGLLPIFTDRELKKRLVKHLDVKDYVHFQTVWEGVRNLLKAIEKEKDQKAIKADRLLLTEDLKKIRNFVCEKIKIDAKPFPIEKKTS